MNKFGEGLARTAVAVSCTVAGFTIDKAIGPSLAEIKTRNAAVEACIGLVDKTCAIELVPDLTLSPEEVDPDNKTKYNPTIINYALKKEIDPDPEKTVYDRMTTAVVRGLAAGVVLNLVQLYFFVDRREEQEDGSQGVLHPKKPLTHQG